MSYEHRNADGQLHRIDGPVVEWEDGRKEWRINGQHVTEEINNWLHENNIQYPFDEDNIVQFKLRWL